MDIPYLTPITTRLQKLYSTYTDLTHPLFLLIALALAAALLILIAGLFVDDVILRLRDGLFSLVLVGVKVTLGTLGYELVDVNIRGVNR